MSKFQREEFDYEDYARKMRSALCDKHSITADGDINHKYFLVKKGQYWSEEMQRALVVAIGKEGVGSWATFIKGDLKHCSEIELELRTCLTLGISDISKYNGKRLNPEQIAKEHDANLKRAEENDKLKFGIYII